MHEGIAGRSDLGELGRRIADIDLMFASGVERLQRAIRSDGHLAASDKALIVVATTAVRDPAALSIEIDAARVLGNTADSLRAVALTLYLSRGARPCRDLLDALGTGNAEPVGATTITPPDSISVEEIVEQFSRVFGTVPDRVSLLVENSHDGLEAYHRMRLAALSHGRLDSRIAELTLMAVNAAEHRGDFAAVHASGARRAGATEPQLVEAGLCTIPAGGVAAWLAASEAIVATRTTQEPNPAHISASTPAPTTR